MTTYSLVRGLATVRRDADAHIRGAHTVASRFYDDGQVLLDHPPAIAASPSRSRRLQQAVTRARKGRRVIDSGCSDAVMFQNPTETLAARRA